MNLQKKFKKEISLLLVISIISINLSFLTFPQKINAQWEVNDPGVIAELGVANAELTIINTSIGGLHAQIGTLNGQTAAKTIWQKLELLLQKALTTIAKIAAKKFIAMVTQATVDWINGGFNGNPAYISDFGKFMSGTGGVADQTIGQIFANDSNFAFLCSPFKIQIKMALQLAYGAPMQGIGCTLSQVINNSTAAANGMTFALDVNGHQVIMDKNGNVISGFAANGGWNSWLKNTLQPQNNPQGAFFIAKANADAQIETAQGSKSFDLLNGQGALSYKTCEDTYYNPATGEQIGDKSKEYTADANSNPPVPKDTYDYSSKDANGEYVIHVMETARTTKTNCVMKTPGSAITGMLFQKTTSEVRQSEMVSALADGFDQIFSALINAAITLALNQLHKGVLNSDQSSYGSYMSTLDTTMGNAINNFGSDLSQLYIEQQGLNGPNPIYPTSTNTIIPPISLGSTTWNYDPTIPPSWNYDLTSTSTGAGVTYTDLNGDIIYSNMGNNSIDINTGYGNNALERARSNANTLINSLLKSESDYQNTHLLAQTILMQAESIFATSSACNMSYNRNDTILRSLLIRSNIITNIEGSYSSDRSIASIPWNLEIIKAALDNSNAKIAILNKATAAVSGASSLQNITDAMLQVNSASFDTDPKTEMIANIKTWLRGVQGMYNSPLCPIDLIRVMQINSIAKK